MPIISVEIMKTTDEGKIQKTKKQTNKDRKEQAAEILLRI